MASPLFAPPSAASALAGETPTAPGVRERDRVGSLPAGGAKPVKKEAALLSRAARARYLREASALLLFVGAVLTTLALASYSAHPIDPAIVGADWVGPVGAGWAGFLVGTVGVLAWAVPVELALLTWPLLKDRASIATIARLAGNILSCFVLAALVHVAMPTTVSFGAMPVGGSLGELFGEVLRSLFSTVGSFLVGLTAVALIFIGRQSFSFIRMAQRATHGTEVAATKAASGAKAVADAWERAADLKKRREDEERSKSRPVIHDPSPTALAIVAGMDEPSPDDMPLVRVAAGADAEPMLDFAPPARSKRLAPAPDLSPAPPAVAVTPEEPAPPAKATRARKPKKVEPPPEPVIVPPVLEESPEPSGEVLVGRDHERDEEPAPEEASPEPSEAAPAVIVVAPPRAVIDAPAPIQIVEHVEEARVEKPSFSLDRLVPAVGAGFRLPSTDFFDPPGDNLPKEDPQALYERATQLTRVLSTYGVSGTVADIHTGPTVSTFELIPEEGTRVNKVAGLSDDLALGLACPVRIIAPIPNKNRIGFEIPNKDRIPVNLRELVEDRRFVESSYPLPVVLGRDIVGKPFFADLASMPHVIVAGATGAGKSVGLNVMLTSLLTRRTPEELRMLMIDPKVVELAPFDKIPHLLLPVVTDMKQAANALKWAVDEMERRYQLFANAGTKNIATFNGWVERCARGEVRGYVQTKVSTQVLEDGSLLECGPEKDAKPLPEKLPYIVIVVDEFADLMMQQGKEVEASVARLAQKARAAGMHVILATQRPSVDVITGMIKANFPTRIAFKVTQKVDSRTILDEMGADQLLGRGDMLVKLNGTNETRRVQCPFVSEEEVQKITDFLRLQGEPVYDERILAPRDEDGAVQEDEDGELDAKYDDAVRVVADTRRCSTSWLQRKLGLGYNRAAKIVETMEKRGIVGPANGAKDREVLIAPTLRERTARVFWRARWSGWRRRRRARRHRAPRSPRVFVRRGLRGRAARARGAFRPVRDPRRHRRWRAPAGAPDRARSREAEARRVRLRARPRGDEGARSSPRQAVSAGGDDPPPPRRAPRRFGERLVPSLVLPALVVTSLALLIGERLRDRARVSTPSPVIVASAGAPALSVPARTTVSPSSRRSGGSGAVRKGPPTMRHLDPARTNRSPFAAPARPTVTWTVELGAPSATSPVVAAAKDGAARLVLTTLAGSVVFLDLSGKEQARAELGERIYGSPAVLAGLVWIGLDHGSVVGVDPDNAKIVRRLRLERDKDDADTALLPDEASPATLFFAAGPTVYRVRTDGTFLFRETLPRKVYGSAARLRDGGVVVGGQDDTLTLLEADGRIRRRIALGGDVDGSPAIADDGTIYVGTDGDEVVALTPGGEIAWRRAVQGPVRGALAVARDGVVLASTYGPTPAILGLDPLDGHPVLRYGLQGTGAREHGIHGAPIEAEGGTLLFGGPDDLVHALAPDGSFLWAVDVGDDVDGTLALIDDRVVVASTSAGRVVRIDAAP